MSPPVRDRRSRTSLTKKIGQKLRFFLLVNLAGCIECGPTSEKPYLYKQAMAIRYLSYGRGSESCVPRGEGGRNCVESSSQPASWRRRPRRSAASWKRRRSRSATGPVPVKRWPKRASLSRPSRHCLIRLSPRRADARRAIRHDAAHLDGGTSPRSRIERRRPSVSVATQLGGTSSGVAPYALTRRAPYAISRQAPLDDSKRPGFPGAPRPRCLSDPDSA